MSTDTAPITGSQQAAADDALTQVQRDKAIHRGDPLPTETTAALDAKRKPRIGSYTVFEKTGPETFTLIATDVKASNDRKAIEQHLADDASGTFVAVPRWNERTVAPQTVTKRSWS